MTLDLEYPRFHKPQGIIDGLRREIFKVTGTEPWRQNFNDDPYEVEDGLILLREKGYRLIVILDDFEEIMRRLELFKEWGNDWRAKASHNMLSMVIASKRPFSQYWREHFDTSGFSNIFQIIFLGALDGESWHSLVKDGFIQSGEVDVVTDKLIDGIDELAGGLPFYVKMAASMFWQFTPTRKEFLETPYIVLEDWLEQALPKLGERRLLLNLDAFEKIGIAIKEKRLSLNLFDELRHLIQHYDSLAFLFSGVQTLDELGPNWSSYFISVVPLEMTYLEPDEAESLLTNPDPEFALHYDRGIVEEIIQLTRCQPYLLQLLGSALVTQANLNHTQLVTPDLLQAAIPEAFTNGEPYFTNVWTEFTGNNPAEIIAGQEFLLELANGLAPGHSQDLTDAAIRRLRRYHAIEQTDNGYVFEVPLLERWVRERAVKNTNY